jgi:hypothetical protein
VSNTMDSLLTAGPKGAASATTVSLPEDDRPGESTRYCYDHKPKGGVGGNSNYKPEGGGVSKSRSISRHRPKGVSVSDGRIPPENKPEGGGVSDNRFSAYGNARAWEPPRSYDYDTSNSLWCEEPEERADLEGKASLDIYHPLNLSTDSTVEAAGLRGKAFARIYYKIQPTVLLSGTAGLEGKASAANCDTQIPDANKPCVIAGMRGKATAVIRHPGFTLHTGLCQVRCREKEEHPLSNCSKYLSLSLGRRWETILKRKLCLEAVTCTHSALWPKATIIHSILNKIKCATSLCKYRRP